MGGDARDARDAGDVTSMVGRRAEVAEVKRALCSSRPVTLTDVAGVGKTRLALQVSRQLRRAFPGGVWLAAPAELGAPQLLAMTVTQALGMRGAGPDPMAELVDDLRDKRLLIGAGQLRAPGGRVRGADGPGTTGVSTRTGVGNQP
ncbi:hypothetical protein ACFW1M_16205 [Streptomyces inhibens]|uniref:hypothetical protein n=1 Tax=Streptomyces inhibens TaxID=2293571 RepID=UPI0036C469EF